LLSLATTIKKLKEKGTVGLGFGTSIFF